MTHPYDLAFGRDAMDDRLFPPIAEEAAARGAPVDDPDGFVMLGSVGHLLRAVGGGAEAEGAPADEQAEETGGARDAGEAPDGLRHYGIMLFHAFHFWRAGRPTVALDEATLRRLLEDPGEAPAEGWTLALPAPAGYLRLPRNLVWAAAAEGLRPEPADGFFWTLAGTARPAVLHLLLALGVREDRPGFSIAPAAGSLDERPHWATIDARPDGPDFETTLPGGDLDRLYSIETPAEILKLASLCFLHLDRTGG